MIFNPVRIGNITLKNRMIRSATFEGMCDKDGFPTLDYEKLYKNLAQQEIGGIITGFAFIENDGRAIHPGQAGIDNANKIEHYKKITELVHKYDSKIFMQIAHTGRQTLKKVTGENVWSVSNKKSKYFNSKTKILTSIQILSIINKFVDSAYFAQSAGFDGIQLHAAHGYLIHQFINSNINNRKDIFGIDKKIGVGIEFLSQIIDKIRRKCGENFPILIKISADEKEIKKFRNLIKFLDTKKVNAIEISYGTMEQALNIFRGNSIPLDTIAKFNAKYKMNNKLLTWFWKKLAAPFIRIGIKKFTPTYNLEYAKIAKQLTNIPIICVGGFRSGTEISEAIINKYTDIVSLSRPFICEPDFVKKIKNDLDYKSKCFSCNICAIMCDSPYSTKCYHGKEIF